MQPGKLHRWQRIFRPDGRALVVAMDHASAGVLPGLERPGETIARLVDGGVDAIMTSYGTAKTFTAQLKGKGLILRIDDGKDLKYPVEEALRIGADAVITMGMLYEELWAAENMGYVARTASDCEHWGMPYLLEMVPVAHQPVLRDPNKPPKTSLPEAVAQACRIGAELGADFIKVMYTGSAETFRKVTEVCYIPILILGGPFKEGRTREVLQTIRDALDAGGAGVVMGRNIYQHPQPERIARAIGALIHENASVDEAMKLLP
ncbi:MAG: aldolase [Anaerolineae bacterium]|nr:aldolase [Anaerolineae bacterium]